MLNRIQRGMTAIAACLFSVVAATSASAQLLSLQQIVQGDAQPTGIHHPGDGSGRLFLVSKAGNILVYENGAVLPQSFLDLRSLVNSSGVERGMHGLAFHPNYATNGLFYLMYTNLASDSTLARYQVSADPNVADPASAQILLVVDQPDQYHNISQLQFGPDGYLYIGAGDGGLVGDPANRAQNLGDWLGKIHRIDVDGGVPYGIPADNPFVDVPGARPEIWAYGLRNPWRFSFDRLTGDMYIGDVGQWTWEEVSFQPASSPGGENYGWRLMEGNHCYNPATGCESPDLTLPILEFQHTGGKCSVTGGYVYRGARFPRFRGVYFYGDWCSGKIWAARNVSGNWVSTEFLDATINPTTFGEGEDGTLYVGDDGSGRIYELIDPRPFCDVAMSQASYTDGDIATATSVRIVNLGTATIPAGYLLVLIRPTGSPQVLANGAFPLAPGTETNNGPINLFSVNPDTDTGVYNLVCRLVSTQSGATISRGRATFTVQ